MLTLLADGRMPIEIAVDGGVTEGTIRSRMLEMRRTLDVRTTAELIAYAARRGWIGWKAPPPPIDPGSLAAEKPFLAAYLQAFDEALAETGWPPEPTKLQRHRMDVALFGNRLSLRRRGS